MRFKVPQNVDIEDKIVGPLSGKQFLWVLGGAAILFLVYRFVDTALFVAIALVVMGISCAFAFARPYGQSMISFLSHLILYGTKDKQYVWKREEGQFKEKKVEKEAEDFMIIKKDFPEEKVSKLSEILDTDGEADFFSKANLKSATDQEDIFESPADTTLVSTSKEIAEKEETEGERQARMRNEERTQASENGENSSKKLAQEYVDKTNPS